MTDWVDYHFGIGANKAFGTKFKDLTDILTKAASEADPTARLADYKIVNNLIQQHVPMIPLNHAASAAAYKADVTGAQASPLGVDIFAVVKPGDRQQIVFDQNAETSGLYCGDESDGDSLRNCEQVYDTLYAYKIGGTDTVPSLRDQLRPELGRHGLDLQVAGQREVRRRVGPRRQRRRHVARGPVGPQQPAARRQRRHVRLLGSPVGRVHPQVVILTPAS